MSFDLVPRGYIVRGPPGRTDARQLPKPWAVALGGATPAVAPPRQPDPAERCAEHGGAM